jgi:di/tricarboxylate transporter
MKENFTKVLDFLTAKFIIVSEKISIRYEDSFFNQIGKTVTAIDSDHEERGDVPGWVLVVLMTTGLVTAIWTIAAPRLSTILRNSLDAMNGIR